MKFKTLLVSALIGLSLTACNDKEEKVAEKLIALLEI